jgi:hypothetical protein
MGGGVGAQGGSRRRHVRIRPPLAKEAPETAPAYREILPPECPPGDAIVLDRQIVIRLVPANPAVSEDFDSHAKAGRKCPHGCSPCQWAACSVFVDPMRPEQITDLLKLPKMRQMHFFARLLVDINSGKARLTKGSGHISLWMYASFNPVLAIQGYTACP